MMSLPWFLAGLLAATAPCFAMGWWAGRRIRGRRPRAALWLAAAALGSPALFFAAHYLHLFDRMAWVYEVRATPGVEWLAAGAGFSAGLACVGAGRVRRCGVLVSAGLLLVAPYAKPLLLPLPAEELHERWRGGVCLQSTMSTCGPASAATLLRAAGLFASESVIARACLTSGSGTEAWYLIRHLRSRGMRVACVVAGPSEDPPAPAIAGIKMGTSGHFIPILARTPQGGYVTGDPVRGRQEWAPGEIRRGIAFTGFYIKVEPDRP